MARRTGWKEPSCSRSTPFSAWGSSSLADLALTLIMAVWGSSFAIVRSLLGAAETSALLLVAVRMMAASALLAGFMAVGPGRRAQLRAVRGELLRDGMFAGGLLGIGFLLQTEGLQRTTASRSGFLTGTLVVMVPLIEFGLFRKRPTLPALLGVLLAFTGMTALSAPWSDASQATALGDGLTLACAVVFAGQIVALGRVAPKHPVLPLVLVQLATTGALAALVGPFVEVQHFSAAPRLWAAVLYLAVFATLLAFGIQTWAQKILPPVRVALISALEPVVAALWAGRPRVRQCTARRSRSARCASPSIPPGTCSAARRSAARPKASTWCMPETSAARERAPRSRPKRWSSSPARRWPSAPCTGTLVTSFHPGRCCSSACRTSSSARCETGRRR